MLQPPSVGRDFGLDELTEAVVKVNRSPVMTLWATVLMHENGYSWAEALSLGSTVTGLNARAKGERLGIFDKDTQSQGSRPATANVEVLGRAVPCCRTEDGEMRGVLRERPVQPSTVLRGLKNSFANTRAVGRVSQHCKCRELTCSDV